MTLVIEKNIPVPRKASGGKPGELVTALRVMEVGDSVFLAGRTVMSCGQPMLRAKADSDRQYTSRTVDGGVRIWRKA
jgi:hypothetical protein